MIKYVLCIVTLYNFRPYDDLYECCRENGFNVTWVEEADALRMSPTKEDVFIMSEFAGRLFINLQRFKCTIIGPQCLLVSVQKGEPLPDSITTKITINII